MPVLVTGGAGFIGRHTSKILTEPGREIVVLDNLKTGRRGNLRCGFFVNGAIGDLALVRRVIRERGITSVIHLAASAQVGDSMLRPDEYFANNVTGSLTLLEAMAGEGVKQLVFASSCSVYGNPDTPKVREDQAVGPLSPYGESKLFIERVLPWHANAYGLRWVALRYFNAAGAEGDLGEEPTHSKRIIPRVAMAALGVGGPLQIFGTSYPTCDGTAVRDYVHVNDIARANALALQFVEAGRSGAVLNIGSGVGVSIRQILDCVGRETGGAVPCVERPERPGDAASIASDPACAWDLLGWRAVQSDLAEIVASAVASYRRHVQNRT